MPETAPCNLCGDPNGVAEPLMTRLLDVPEPLQIRRCGTCSLRRLSPRLTLDELQERYASHWYYSASNAVRGAGRTQFYHAKLARLERWWPQRGKLLGVGCLEGGHLLQIASTRGWEVTGVEFSSILAGYAREQLRLDVRGARGWDLSEFCGAGFDAIVSLMFEHLPDPTHTLRQCRAALRPNGLLFLEVPFQFGSLADLVRLAAVSRNWTTVTSRFQREVVSEFHLSYFAPPTIRRLLGKMEFDVLTLRTYLPWNPVYRGRPLGGWLHEAIYAVGALVGRGPSIEIVARARD